MATNDKERDDKDLEKMPDVGVPAPRTAGKWTIWFIAILAVVLIILFLV